MTERHYEPVYYPSADNRLRLFARDYPSTDASSDSVPLLMMHGLTRNSADFEPLINTLAPHHRMIVPDQRGRANSDYDPVADNYEPSVYVEDMWALLGHLEIKKVICIGTSMGGLMSMMMGALEPGRIKAMVLNDIGPHVSEEGLDRIRSYVGPSEPMPDWRAAADRCKSIMSEAFDGFEAADWFGFAQRVCEELNDGTVCFAYDPAISKGMAKEDTSAVPPDLWSMWDKLREHPILAVRGAKSDILEAQTVAEMARRHPENFDSVEVPGRGHAPLLDEPEAVSAISNFLSENDR